jgi:poly(hydroxyalkanoate) depolymerase family esterase
VIALAAALVQVMDFGSNPGALDMYEYVPASLPANAPLVVVMHGCTQDASGIANAGWNALADAHGFAVVYPQQRAANQPLDCFDWYTPSDTSRGAGEAASIVAMVDHEVATRAIDRSRVYVTGLSAGGAFTAVLLAAYPDRFAAGSVMSGLPYGCAKDLASASACQQGATKTASAWGDLARAGDPGFAGSWPRVQIWQGDKDTTVAPANADALVAQWTNVRGADQTVRSTDQFATTTRTTYANGDVELYVVAGMGHAVAIGADPAMGACPATQAMWFEDHRACSTLRAADFFGVLGAAGSGGDNDGAAGVHRGGCDIGGSGALAALAMLPLRRRARAKT